MALSIALAACTGLTQRAQAEKLLCEHVKLLNALVHQCQSVGGFGSCVLYNPGARVPAQTAFGFVGSILFL